MTTGPIFSPGRGGGGGGGGTPGDTVVTETAFGQASAAGALAAYSRADHTHGTPADPGGGGVAFPVFPHSTYPVTGGKVFPNFHVGAGANSKHDEGLGVMASLDGDAIWRLRFQMPPVLPAGTGKLRLLALAASEANAAKVNPKWVSVAVEEDPSAAALNAEGTGTITWAAADDDVYKELKITLDADTLVASEEVVMDLTFETAAWTLAVVSTWIASIIWE